VSGRGPETVHHACGHPVAWRAEREQAPILWGRFLRLLEQTPCPWCGGETGSPRAPRNVALIGVDHVPGLTGVTAEKT
jgi:hypothetical protein